MARNWSSRYHSLWVVIFPIVVVLVLLLLVRSFSRGTLTHSLSAFKTLADIVARRWSRLARRSSSVLLLKIKRFLS
ncbi:hypothetical protein AAHA92_28278 [Salvia divinorum]|uniref:Uncharacterized protein n=1 Tax=Salvia divinorum TaxID=28513 RepID=A0ABD1FUK4_SALDI